MLIYLESLSREQTELESQDLNANLKMLAFWLYEISLKTSQWIYSLVVTVVKHPSWSTCLSVVRQKEAKIDPGTCHKDTSNMLTSRRGTFLLCHLMTQLSAFQREIAVPYYMVQGHF